MDIDPKSIPTICCDIMELEIEDVLESGNVDLIWASPPLHPLQLRKDERKDRA